jgi:hypothetical protein
MRYKTLQTLRKTHQDIAEGKTTITEASKHDSALTKIIFMEAEIRKIWKVEGKACEQAFELAVKAAADMKKKLDSIAIKDDESFVFAMNNLNRSAFARYDDQPYDNIDDIEENTRNAIGYFKPLKPK